MVKKFPLGILIFIALSVLGILYINGNIKLPFTVTPIGSTLTVMEPDWATLSCETGEGKSANFVTSSDFKTLSTGCSAYTGQSDRCTTTLISVFPDSRCSLYTSFLKTANGVYVNIYKNDVLEYSGCLTRDGVIRQSCYNSDSGYNSIYNPTNVDFNKNYKIVAVSKSDTYGDVYKFSGASGSYKEYWKVLKYRTSAQGSPSYLIIPNTEGCYYRDVDTAIKNVAEDANTPTRSQMQSMQGAPGTVIPTTNSGQLQSGVTYAFVIGYHQSTVGALFNVDGKYAVCRRTPSPSLLYIDNINGINYVGSTYKTYTSSKACCVNGECTTYGSDWQCDNSGSNPTFECKQNVQAQCYTDVECGPISPSPYKRETDGKCVVPGEKKCQSNKCVVVNQDKVVDQCPSDCKTATEVYDYASGKCIVFQPTEFCPTGMCCVGREKNQASPFAISQECASGLNCVIKTGEFSGTCLQNAPPKVCGNQICDSGETAVSCPEDCLTSACNGVCEVGDTTKYLIQIGENGLWKTTEGICPSDCKQTTTSDYSILLWIILGIVGVVILIFVVPWVIKKLTKK